MSKLFDARVLLALSSAVLLAACGGGGDGDAAADDTPVPAEAPALDKYLGTWQGCTVNGTGKSVRATYEISKKDADFSYLRRQETFNSNEACSGTADVDFKESGPITLNGKTTVVDGVTMDQATLTLTAFTLSKGSISGFPTQGPYQQLLGIVDTTKLREGDLKSAKDAQGYPTQLGSVVFTKQ